MTSEGREKKVVKAWLDDHHAYHFWPVQTGYGQPALDCIASIPLLGGRCVGIEVKVPKGRFTARQRKIIQDMIAAGALVVCGTAADIIVALENAIDARKRALEARTRSTLS